MADDVFSVDVATVDRVTTVVMNRPARRNAVNGAMAAELARAFRCFEADPEADVAVLTGEGGTFCAGADLASVGTSGGNVVAMDGDGPMGPTRMVLSKPVIAAIEGYAVAGGLELAIWCDLRVSATDSVLGVFCRRFGVPLVDGGTFRLPRLIGAGRAMDLILTGRPVDAAEALSIGLVDRVVPSGTARAAAEELARSLTVFPQACLRNDRRAAREQAGLTEPEAIDLETRLGLVSLHSDAVSGASRFVRGDGRHGSFEQTRGTDDP